MAIESYNAPVMGGVLVIKKMGLKPDFTLDQ
jgi:hypothetical protein